MILTIDKKERELFQKACADLDLMVDFYTDEANPVVLRCEIVVDRHGDIDITPRIALSLGRCIQMLWQAELDKTYTNKL